MGSARNYWCHDPRVGYIRIMPSGEQRTRTAFAMSVTAAIRARLGVMGADKSIRWLSEKIGVSSNYLSKRLRDVSPLSVDDLACIVQVIEPTLSLAEFVALAWERYRVESEAKLRRIEDEQKSPGLPEQPTGDAHQLGDGALTTGKAGVTLRAQPQPERAPGQQSTRPPRDIDPNL